LKPRLNVILISYVNCGKCIYEWLGFMFRHGFIKSNDINLLYIYCKYKLLNYLLRVVLDFNSVVFMFCFNWMRVTDYCILLIINLLILESTSLKGSGWE
jgi:hypothetical protein